MQQPTVSRPAVRRSRRAYVSSAAALLAVGTVATACRDDAPTNSAAPALARAAGYTQPGAHLQYGAPVKVGDGRARAYVVIDQQDGKRALEFGVALDERAMEGLPSGGGHQGGGHEGHVMANTHLLPLPAQNPTSFKLVELNWNASGHEPAGVYDAPHFDFHFYTVTKAARDAIDPSTMSDAEYVERSMNYPMSVAPQFFVPLAAPGQPNRAVPQMGVHWSDVRSPELQRMLGKPQDYKPFTATFTYGSWDGEFTFAEPMITRAHLLEKRTSADPAVRDQLIPLPTSAAFPSGAFRPDAYRITYDGQAREYRIALTAAGDLDR